VVGLGLLGAFGGLGGDVNGLIGGIGAGLSVSFLIIFSP